MNTTGFIDSLSRDLRPLSCREALHRWLIPPHAGHCSKVTTRAFIPRAEATRLLYRSATPKSAEVRMFRVAVVGAVSMVLFARHVRDDRYQEAED